MDTNEFNKACSEVLEIFKYIDKKRLERIPKEIMELLIKNQSLEYNTKIDFGRPLEEQNLTQKTKDILVTLYVEYLCEEEQKEEINKILRENYIKEQNELKQKYSTENIFKNKYESKNEEHLELVHCTENVFIRILKKIKQLLKFI